MCGCGTDGLGDHAIGHVTGDIVCGVCHHPIGDTAGGDGVQDMDDDAIDRLVGVDPGWFFLGRRFIWDLEDGPERVGRTEGKEGIEGENGIWLLKETKHCRGSHQYVEPCTIGQCARAWNGFAPDFRFPWMVLSFLRCCDLLCFLFFEVMTLGGGVRCWLGVGYNTARVGGSSWGCCPFG